MDVQETQKWLGTENVFKRPEHDPLYNAVVGALHESGGDIHGAAGRLRTSEDRVRAVVGYYDLQNLVYFQK